MPEEAPLHLDLLPDTYLSKAKLKQKKAGKGPFKKLRPIRAFGNQSRGSYFEISLNSFPWSVLIIFSFLWFEKGAINVD